MKKLKNKFILLIILIISVIIISQVYIAYSHGKNDTNSYVKLIKWKALLNETFLTLEEKYILSSGDKIITQDDSLAVIEWWDGSLTRLWENTKITIEQNQISKDYTEIDISFDLLAWKTWSQVISFIGKDSSFTQNFNGIEAGVRGTTFDVDLTEDFLRVTDHAVTLTKDNGDMIEVTEWDVLNLKNFSLVQISEFIRDMEDKAWSKLNFELDEDYLAELQEKLQAQIGDGWAFLFILDFFSPKYRILYEIKNSERFEEVEESIAKLDEEQKTEVYDAVLSEYQEYNFVKVSNYDAYKRKIFFKRALVLLTSDQNEIERLMQTSSYDLADAAKQNITLWMQETLNFIENTSQKIPNLEFTLPEVSLDYLPEWLREQFEWSIRDIGSYLNFDTINIPTNLNDLDSGMQDFLDNTVGGFLDSINN